MLPPKPRTHVALAIVLTLVFSQAITFRLSAATEKVVNVPSTAMAREISTTVILPDTYESDPQKRFPVLYLLHGAGNDHRAWVTHVPAIKDEADKRQFIIVCPNAELSWYFDSPVNPKVRFETFCAAELVGWMDQQYRTRPQRQSRATCGVSMGGHGALWLALRHKEVFATTVPFSGGVDVRPFNSWNLPGNLGDHATHPENWETHSVINLVPTLKDNELAIYMDCGDADFFLEVNRHLHQVLTDAGIKHQYLERPGGHNWSYWAQAFPLASPFIEAQFSKN